MHPARFSVVVGLAIAAIGQTSLAQHASVGTAPVAFSVLRELGEPVLNPGAEHRTVFRALWLRSFHNPVSVRLVDDHGTYSVITSEVAMHGDSVTGVVRRDSLPLPREAWDLLQRRLAIEQFFNRSYWRMTKPKSMGLDGANWILEGLKDGKYQYIDWWSPDEREGREGLFRRLFLEILSMGTVCVPPNAVY